MTALCGGHFLFTSHLATSFENDEPRLEFLAERQIGKMILAKFQITVDCENVDVESEALDSF